MKIAITGAAGFLGSHLADKLLSEGYQVVGVDNLLGGYVDNVPSGVEFHQIDCLRLSQMRTVLDKVDVVYHCAAAPYEGLSVFSPHVVTQSIFGTTTATLSAALNRGVKRFILCSSMARYGTQHVPFTEDMTPKPQDPYGIAKVASEEVVRNLCTTHRMEWVIAVPHNIIGPRQKYDDPYRNVASIMANRMLQGKPPVIYGDGEQQRCFSFIQDVIDPLVKMATFPVSGEIFNIGPDEEFVTINHLSNLLRDITGFRGSPIHFPSRPQEVKMANASAKKTRKLLGYRTTTSLEQGLVSIVEYIKQRGVKPFKYHLPLEFVTDKTPETWSERLM